MTPRMTLAHWGVLVLTAALFGSSFFFIKISVDSIPPLTLAAGRATLAALALVCVLRAAGARLPALGREWLPILVLGLLTAAFPYAAIAWGQRHIDSSLGGILFATIPVFSVLIAPLFLKEERFTAGRVAGAAIGLTGVAMAIGLDALMHLEGHLMGAAATLAAALSYASGTIYARLQSHLSPLVLATGQLVIGSLVLVPLSLTMDAPWTLAPSQTALISLGVVALVNTAAPVLLVFWLVRNAGASNTALLAFFMPVAAILLGTLVLGEPLSWGAFGGFALILVGAGLVTGTLKVPVSFIDHGGASGSAR